MEIIRSKQIIWCFSIWSVATGLSINDKSRATVVSVSQITNLIKTVGKGTPFPFIIRIFATIITILLENYCTSL